MGESLSDVVVVVLFGCDRRVNFLLETSSVWTWVEIRAPIHKESNY